jgi:hypothetical protein
MSTVSPFLQPQTKAPINRGNQFGSEALEKKDAADNAQASQKAKVDSYNSWNAFLSPTTEVKIERLDTRTPASSSPVQTVQVEEKKPTFEEIFAKLNGTQNEIPNSKVNTLFDGVQERPQDILLVEEKQISKLEGSVFFSKSENIAVVKNLEAKDSDLQPKGPSFIEAARKKNNEQAEVTTEKSEGVKKGSVVFNRESLMGSAEKVANSTTKVAKFGFKEGKYVFGAVKDLWTNFIGFREKKLDPKAKENAEKAAKRKANKQRFVGLLREGMSIYYAEMRKALIELEVKLGVNVLRAEDKNRLLGRSRNMSFEKHDSVYEIHQIAFAMAEEKKQQQQASKSAPTARGKSSRGQIFTDKNLSGERSAGNNMMSAVG